MKKDQILIEKINRGDLNAFRSFFESFYPSLCIFTRKYVSDPDESEDIVQDAFIKFWTVKKEYKELNAAKSYLYTIVKNDSLNYLRHKTITSEYIKLNYEKPSLFNDYVIEEETYRIINSAITNLPPRMKQIIELSLKGVNNSDIAENLNVSVNTIKSLKKTAYKKLRAELREHTFILLIIGYYIN